MPAIDAIPARAVPSVKPRIAVVIFALLAACMPNVSQKSQPPAGQFRDQSRPLYSTAGLRVARLLGNWQQVAGYGPAPACARLPAITFQAVQDGVHVAYDLCFANERASGAGALTSDGAQGRYRLPNFLSPIWVLWIDQDNRTMAIGSPDNRIAMILAKSPPPADHIRAAREILAWNGYDLAKFYQY
ncbi:MAG: lipocalin family protein [Cypionkella sp.]|nr:lipocalin family protein [Cypionkella sp.]